MYCQRTCNSSSLQHLYTSTRSKRTAVFLCCSSSDRLHFIRRSCRLFDHHLIYVNDMYSCIDDATVKLFADDTNLFVSGQSIDEVTAIANMCIFLRTIIQTVESKTSFPKK